MMDNRELPTLEDISENLSEISKNIEFIRDYYERNPMPYVIDKTQYPVTPFWRYLLNWVLFIVVVLIIANGMK